MGFSVTCTLGSSYVFFKNSHQKSANFLSFDRMNFKISKFKPRLTRISSRKPEIFEFEERTSPNEYAPTSCSNRLCAFACHEFNLSFVLSKCKEKKLKMIRLVLIYKIENTEQKNLLGRGVAYLGSSRMGPTHPHYLQALELGKEIAILLNCTSWTGAGPGLMDAATKGAMQAGKPVGGFKISKEAGEWTATNFHPYLPSETYLTCRFFSARKHGLVDAVVRSDSSDRTAVVALPGGVGTLDEVFEILALIQLERIGSELPVPFLLMNYDSFYSKLLDFLNDCEHWGTVAKGGVSSLWKVCDNNLEALAYLEEFYDLPTDQVRHRDKLRSPHRTVS
ncbi:unnamed protein product [Camellia sinensis]